MGSTFRYIADEALEPCGGSICHHCERDNLPVYYYRGMIIDPSLAKNPQLATEYPTVYELCADCILSQNIIKDSHDVSRIEGIANAYAPDFNAAMVNYHTIPDIPGVMEDRDWPMCCGDWCEFRGNPSDDQAVAQVPIPPQYWDHSPEDCHFDFNLISESLSEVSIFQCLTCEKSYFIWQPT